MSADLLLGLLLGFILGVGFGFMLLTRMSEDYPLDRPVRKG